MVGKKVSKKIVKGSIKQDDKRTDEEKTEDINSKKETELEEKIHKEEEMEDEKNKNREPVEIETLIKAKKENQSAKNTKEDGDKNQEPGIIRTNKEDDTKRILDDREIDLVEAPATGVDAYNMIIDSIIENLKIVIGGSQTLHTSMFDELVNIEKASVEMPRELTKMDPEVEIISDPLGRWAIHQGRIRSTIASWNEYEDFLKYFRHTVEKGVKELYCIYRITEETYENGRRLISPTMIGFASDPRMSFHLPTKTLVPDNTPVFQIIGDGNIRDADTIPILMNPVLIPILEETQNFLHGDPRVPEGIREWVIAFVAKKDQYMDYGMSTVYDVNSVRWLRCPHPRHVGNWLNLIPNMNRISIPYALKYTGPRATTRPVNVTTGLSALSVTTSNMSILSRLVTEPLTERNRTDIENILRAHMLPGQIQIEIEYTTGDPPELHTIAALAAKLLFSGSVETRNIIEDTIMQSDRAIATFLTNIGYRSSQDARFPLNVRRPGGMVSAFSDLQSNLQTGKGWCNSGGAGWTAINNPLYDGLNRLPQLADIAPNRTPVGYMTMGNIANPQIVENVHTALGELVKESRKDGQAMLKWFNMLNPYYLSYAAELNRYMLAYGECGFRMQDRRLNEMMMGAIPGHLGDAYNTPLTLTVMYDSIYKYFRALPEKLNPPPALAEQINAESLVSAELQRVISAFLIMRDRLAVDNYVKGFVPRKVFSLALANTESNHFAKKIFELCLSDGESSRLRLNTFDMMRGSFDEFEAIYFERYARIVTENPETFGFSFNVTRKRRDLPTFDSAEYETLTERGIIMDSSILPRVGEIVRRLTCMFQCPCASNSQSSGSLRNPQSNFK